MKKVLVTEINKDYMAKSQTQWKNAEALKGPKIQIAKHGPWLTENWKNIGKTFYNTIQVLYS